MPVNCGAMEVHHGNIEILTAAQRQADQNMDRTVAFTYGGQERVMTNVEIGQEIQKEEAAVRAAAGHQE